MKKIKILHVQVLPILSGVQNISLDILSLLDSTQYDKYLLCAEDVIENESFARHFEEAGVTIIRFKSLRREVGFHDFKVFFDCYQLIKKHQFDIVHTHSTKPGIVARIAGRLARVKAVIHTIHGVAFHKNEPRVKRIIFYGIEFVATLFGHYLTSVNTYYKQYYRFVSSKRFSVIYNGIDVNTKYTAKASSCNSKNILFLSRLERAKDPLTLLKAVLLLKKNYQRDDFKVKIAGDGELMDSCREYVIQHELESNVEFLGWINDKEQVYRDADIFCVPSVFEAFGLVFAEAGLHGLPTVATTVEGIPEVVVDGKTGYLVCPRREDLLAKKLNYLLDRPDECITLGQNARKHVLQNFTKSRMVNEYKELYLKALK